MRIAQIQVLEALFMEQYLTLQMFNLNPLPFYCVQLKNLDFSITKSRFPYSSTNFILLSTDKTTTLERIMSSEQSAFKNDKASLQFQTHL